MMIRLALTHPSRKRLREWLDDTGTLSTSVDAHLAECERCAGRLEALSAGELADLDRELDVALRSAYRPPDGMTERIMRSIADRERADREMNLLLGLFAIPTDAADLMMPDDPAPDDGDRREPREDI